MAKFRATFPTWSAFWWKYKKNGKRNTSTWLVIEDSGDILAKDILRSAPLGNIKDIVDKSLAATILGKRVSFKNRFGDNFDINLSKRDADTFFSMLSRDLVTHAAQPSAIAMGESTDWQAMIQKLADLKNAGLLADTWDADYGTLLERAYGKGVTSPTVPGWNHVQNWLRDLAELQRAFRPVV